MGLHSLLLALSNGYLLKASHNLSLRFAVQDAARHDLQALSGIFQRKLILPSLPIKVSASQCWQFESVQASATGTISGLARCSNASAKKKKSV
eukprot:SAG11_NODE_427_length_9558_cov_4.909398_11_plen_92_part_01